MKSAVARLLIASLCAAGGVSAQESNVFGVKGGVVFSTVARTFLDRTYDESSRQGFTVGGFYQIRQGRSFYLSVEMLYTQKGYTSDLVEVDAFLPVPGSVLTYDVRADYLSLPLLATVRLGSRGFPPFLFAGPRFDLLLHSDFAFEASRLDVGMTLGVGFQFTIEESPEILIEGRYSPSFTDVSSSREKRNKSYEIMTGVIF
jgi:hypothetical protein